VAANGIELYYDQTWLDYRLLWLNKTNLSIHFGYSDGSGCRHSEALLNTNRVLADRAAIKPGDRVLDAGCGVGGSSLWLARERGARVTAITPVPSQVALARRFIASGDLTGSVQVRQADYTAVPLPDASFDVVWALESLCHAEDKAAFYREAARLLAPGGRIVVAEYMRTRRPLDAAGERLLRQWVTGWAIPDLDTPSEHLANLAAAGFIDERLEDVTEHVRCSLRRLYRIAQVSFPLAVLGRAARLRSTVQHGNVMGSLRPYQALNHGLWFYAIVVARSPSAPRPAVSR
jgi:tocopherol O-methyltransferase